MRFQPRARTSCATCSASSRVFSARCGSFTMAAGGMPKDSQVALHHVRQAHILAQHPAAGYHDGRHALAIQLGGVKGAVPHIIVIAQHDQRVGRRGRVRQSPRIPRQTASRGCLTRNRRPRGIRRKTIRNSKRKENAAVFARVSRDGIQLAQPLGGGFRHDRVVIDFLDAVGLAAGFNDRQDFNVPVIIVGDRSSSRCVDVSPLGWMMLGEVCTTRW